MGLVALDDNLGIFAGGRELLDLAGGRELLDLLPEFGYQPFLELGRCEACSYESLVQPVLADACRE